MDKYAILFILEVVTVLLAIVAGFVGFIYLQIKASSFWRLSSLAVVLILCCLVASARSRQRTHAKIVEQYARQLQLFVNGLDGLATAGRTNDVHEACSNFLESPVLSMNEGDVSNFNNLANHTYGLSIEPQMTVATNKPPPSIAPVPAAK